MAFVGWLLFIVTLIWTVKSTARNHRKRRALTHYTTYLLLSDSLRQQHQADFVNWIKESDETDTSALARRAWRVLEAMADSLAVGPPGVGGSALGASGMVWDVKNSHSIS